MNLKFVDSCEDFELIKEIGAMFPFSFSKQIIIEPDRKSLCPHRGYCLMG